MNAFNGEQDNERVFLDIRFGVLKGEYLPGEFFDRSDLADAYGITPRTATEACAALEAEGYLELLRPGRFAVRRWSVEEVEDLFDIRASVEGLAAGRAAERASRSEVKFLRSLVKPPLGALKDIEEFDRCSLENIMFHKEVLRLSRIRSMGTIVTSVMPNVIHRRSIWAHFLSDDFESYRMHGRIVDAIEEGSSVRARAAMREDVSATRDDVIAVVRGLQDAGVVERRACIKKDFDVASVGKRVIGRGYRESGVDGVVVPFGVGAKPDRKRGSG